MLGHTGAAGHVGHCQARQIAPSLPVAQKLNFAPSSSWRPPVALVICPKLELPSVTPATVPLPVPKKNCGVLVAPNASNRSSRLKRSVNRMDFDSEASRLKKFGPLRKLRPTLPKVLAAGAAKLDVLNHGSPRPIP